MWDCNYPFFASLFVSRLSDQVILFIVPLVIFKVTGSVAWSGAAFFFETLPRFASFPVCGILCDRFSPLKLLRLSQIARALCCIFGILAYHLFGGTGWLIAISAVTGVLTTQGLMGREVMLPQVFASFRFESVASYTQLADQLGTVLGPLLAAVLLQFWGWEYVVITCATMFVAADLMLGLWLRLATPILADPEPSSTHWLQPYRVAVSHIRTLPGLKEVVLLAAAVNMVIGITLATSAAMVTGLFAQTDTYYADLQAAGAVATVVILFWIANTEYRLSFLGILAFITICSGGLLTGLGSTPLLYSIGYVLITGFDKMFGVFIRTVRQKIIPRQDLGKTTGLIVLLNNITQPLAGLFVVAFAGMCGTESLIIAQSLLMGLAGAVIACRFLTRGDPIDLGNST